jgi:threonine/homoserine/homoserine lactone efflux protein
MNIIAITGITILTAIIGALPFGLVNLSVLNTAYRSNRQTALKVAHGASWIEVLYGILALFAGTYIAKTIENSSTVKYIASLIPFFIGMFFLFKKSDGKQNHTDNRPGYLKGVILNLLSIQVLLYWIVAITWLKTSYLPEITPGLILVLIASIWIGKMGVLWLYAQFSEKIMSKSDFLTKNINRFVGAVLIISSLIQFIK